MADHPTVAEPRSGPGPRLGCEVAFGPGAVGRVRYQADTGHGTAGSFTAVGTAPPHLAGTVGLAWRGAALEGLLGLAAPFPAGFPVPAPGTVVTIGGQPCTLQAGGPTR